jgi:putative intracellular protease/amidase
MRIACPLPLRDFDPSEAAVSWSVLRDRGHDVVFATPDATVAACDDLMISGEGLDPWGLVPGLKKLRVFGLLLRANRDARTAYAAMERDPAFERPLAYADLVQENFDGLLLPGGHRARGMRAYLESATLQHFVASMFDAGKPVAAICHGVLLAARSISAKTGRSVLYGRKTTALTWKLESQAWGLARVTRWWDPAYYRTYGEDPGAPRGYNSVQAEVTRHLAGPSDFLEPDPSEPDFARKTSGIARDSASDARPAFVVRDGTYVSGRWPGDAHAFAKIFAGVLERGTAPRSL